MEPDAGGGDEAGRGCDVRVRVGAGVGFGVAFTVGFGVAFTVGFGVGVGVGVAAADASWTGTEEESPAGPIHVTEASA